MKNSNLCKNERYPEFPTLAPFFHLKMAEITKKGILEEKIQPLSYPKIAKSRHISSSLQIKNRTTFALFERFLVKIWARPKVKESESKSNLAYAEAMNPEVLNMQRFWSHHFPIWSLSITNIYIYIFNFHPHFQVSSFVAFAEYYVRILDKNKFDFPKQN